MTILTANTEVFCVFEGGGAKGVAHVGFLKAIDSFKDYETKGFAGTSAGAIIAALAAAGWRGAELFDRIDGKNTSIALDFLNSDFDANITNLSDFLEKEDWRKLSFIKERLNAANVEESGDPVSDIGRTVGRYFGWYLFAAFFTCTIAGLYLFVSIFVNWPNWIALILAALSLITLVPAVVVAVLLKYLSSRYAGLASLERPRQLFEALLRKKVDEALRLKNSQPTIGEVTFSDIQRATGKSLKIVAADLENGNLKLFSNQTTPNTSVSRAVAASAAIPLLFKPIEVDERQYCDGGIVSNLPAWTFDSERLNNEDCLTITCEVSPPRDLKVSRPSLRGLRLFTRVAVTTLFGGSELNTRGMLRHLPLGAWHSIRMLDFEKSDGQIELIVNSEEQAEIQIDLEKRHRQSIDALHSVIKECIENKGLSAGSLRVAYTRSVRLVDAPPVAYHLWNCRGFDVHPDKHITLPAEDSFLGKCLGDDKEGWFDLTDPTLLSEYQSVGGGRLSYRLPKDRAWVAVVPIPEKRAHGRVSVAVCVDSDVPCEQGKDILLPEIGDLVRKYA